MLSLSTLLLSVFTDPQVQENEGIGCRWLTTVIYGIIRRKAILSSGLVMNCNFFLIIINKTCKGYKRIVAMIVKLELILYIKISVRSHTILQYQILIVYVAAN
ncbi:unnamed protein product [Parnassius mnemosyne]|uniref:Uncharacterized protein n=1 Tax=Parnassius mnemosyne TaxID=213953 RepID=A0AAV1KZV9_9NEOP